MALPSTTFIWDRATMAKAITWVEERFPTAALVLGGQYGNLKFQRILDASMRGCPFTCKYCSFPAASPKWRYKSAEKIAGDFARYRDEHGAQYIKALDSTFTVPPTRLRALLPLLTNTGVAWEAYTRANSIRDQGVVDALDDAVIEIGGPARDGKRRLPESDDSGRP